MLYRIFPVFIDQSCNNENLQDDSKNIFFLPYVSENNKKKGGHLRIPLNHQINYQIN